MGNKKFAKKFFCHTPKGRNQKLAKRGLDLTAISLSVSYKRWFGAKPFEVNATVAT